jgi:DNA-binding transcriptional LysR family regulator
MLMLGSFGVLGVVIAAVGICGLMAYVTRARRSPAGRLISLHIRRPSRRVTSRPIGASVPATIVQGPFAVSAGVYHWEFDKHGKPLTVAVNGPLIVDDVEVLVQTAIGGVGLAFTLEEHVAPHVASGALVRVLEDWWSPFPGYELRAASRANSMLPVSKTWLCYEVTTASNVVALKRDAKAG